MITTVIPILNGEKWIVKAIESFLEQKSKKELIIIDSSEKVTKVIKPYLSEEISYYYRPDLEGIFDKCNFGLDIAKGDIFHTMACDHRLPEGTYEFVEEEIKDVDWLFGNVIFLDENEIEVERHIVSLYNLKDFRQNGILTGCACYAKTDFIKKHNLKFNQKYPLNADYDFYLRLAHYSRPKQIHEYLIKTIQRKDGLCDFDNNIEMRKKHRAEIAKQIREEFTLSKVNPNEYNITQDASPIQNRD